MTLTLQAPTLKDCQQVRIWRNECLETLRTPYPMTEEQQEQFYKNVICNRNSNHRYWSIIEPLEQREVIAKNMTGNTFGIGNYHLLGFGGLTFIEWENRQAEISLIIDPVLRGKDYGKKAVILLLDQAFHFLNLQTVSGEVYECNLKGFEFWKKLANLSENKRGCWVILPNRKFWDGHYFNSAYFSFDRDDYIEIAGRIRGI